MSVRHLSETELVLLSQVLEVARWTTNKMSKTKEDFKDMAKQKMKAGAFPESLFDERFRGASFDDDNDDTQVDFIGEPNPDYVGDNPKPPLDDGIPF